MAGGDRAAFSSLYDALSPSVFGLCSRILRSTAMAEEVSQEVFLEVWRKAKDWRPDRAAAATWIFMIARARSIDRVRSEQATQDRQERIAPAWEEPPGSEPAEAVETMEEHAAVRSALARLSEKQRVVIELAYYQGKTYREVAEILDLPIGTVKTRMRDGLMRIRDAYGVSG